MLGPEDGEEGEEKPWFPAVDKALATTLDTALHNPKLPSTLSALAEDTQHKLHTLNAVLETPEVQHELDRSVALSREALNKLDPLIDDTIDKLHEAGVRAAKGAAHGAVSVVSDVVGAIPGVGIVWNGLRAATDVSKAVQEGAEAAREATDAVTTLTDEASRLVRVQDSMRRHTEGGGGGDRRKQRSSRRLFRHTHYYKKHGTKRVRFAV